MCNSEDYEYDDYNYTDDSNDDLNDYHNQNLLAPPNPSPPPPRPFPIPPPPLPPPPMGKITFFYFKYRKSSHSTVFWEHEKSVL